MALVNLDGVPLTQIGFPARAGAYVAASISTLATIDAAGEALMMVGQIWTSDGGTHTIDTTGPSALGWRAQNITFANAGTTVKVGLAAVDTANGPPARAVNAAGVITFNVSRSILGNSSGITGNSWHEHTPDAGTMTISNGDLVAFCVQMTARGGVDIINVGGTLQPYATNGFPCVTSYLSSAYANTAALPNCRIAFNDGARGYFVGGAIQNGALVSTAWNSGSVNKEYGNALTLPFPVRIHGIVGYMILAGPADLILYSSPFSVPVAERTVTLSNRTLAVSAASAVQVLFATPYDAAANQDLAVMVKPGASNATLYSRPAPLAWDADGDSGGESCYGAYRITGPSFPLYFDRYTIGALVQAFEHPARSSHMMGL